MRWVAGVSAAAVLLGASTARAWLFEEHANIGRFASVSLDSRDADTFDALWDAARASSPEAKKWLCAKGRASPTHDRTWSCVDFGALPAASGDHSCTPSEMWTTVTSEPWFRNVYKQTAVTEQDLHKPKLSDANKVDAWHQGNIVLQGVDPDYLGRAKKNNVHFVLARAWDEDTVDRFLTRASRGPVPGTVATKGDDGAPANATHAYAMYHLAALAAAAKLHAMPPGSEYNAAAAMVLATEAFALHFLEDSFSAGHFVGLLDNPGSIAERPGTHDYYCEHGLEGRTWREGISYAAHGDGFQTDECLGRDAGANPATDDAGVLVCDPKTQRTSEGERRSDLAMSGVAVAMSLQQVLRVLRGEALDAPFDPDSDRVRDDNVCELIHVDSHEASVVHAGSALVAEVLAVTPEPYRADPPLPHFRSEIGGYLGGSAAIRGAAASGGGTDPAADPDVRFQSAISIGVGGGVGIEGVTTEATDGVFGGELDLISYGAEKYPSYACTACTTPPTRFGYGFRAHLPFYVIPGDALVSVPLYLFGHDMPAIEAAEGSRWWHFERVHANRISWQIVLGREAAFYNSRQGTFHMSELEIPVLMFRLKHQYSERLGGELSLQVGGTVEWDTLHDGTPSELHTHAGSVFARLSFDGIYYFAP